VTDAIAFCRNCARRSARRRWSNSRSDAAADPILPCETFSCGGRAQDRAPPCFRLAPSDARLDRQSSPEEALALLEPLIGGDFLDAISLFPDRRSSSNAIRRPLPLSFHREPTGGPGGRPKACPFHAATPRSLQGPSDTADASCCKALGVTRAEGRPREGLAAKFRQIQKFAELLGHLIAEAGLASEPGGALKVADMGCGKGYLTFAVSFLLGENSRGRWDRGSEPSWSICAIEYPSSTDSLPASDFPLERSKTPLFDHVDVLIRPARLRHGNGRRASPRGYRPGRSFWSWHRAATKELRPQLVSPRCWPAPSDTASFRTARPNSSPTHCGRNCWNGPVPDQGV